jgi:hypothetical protein
MKVRNLINVVLFGAGLIGAVSANAADNPREPRYFAEKFAARAPLIITTATTMYRDINNPLSPSYRSTASTDAWIPSSDMDIKIYDQSANPLHPMFKRR